MSEAFQQAAEDVKALTKKPSDEGMLEVYALYKQVRLCSRGHVRSWDASLIACMEYSACVYRSIIFMGQQFAI